MAEPRILTPYVDLGDKRNDRYADFAPHVAAVESVDPDVEPPAEELAAIEANPVDTDIDPDDLFTQIKEADQVSLTLVPGLEDADLPDTPQTEDEAPARGKRGKAAPA